MRFILFVGGRAIKTIKNQVARDIRTIALVAGGGWRAEERSADFIARATAIKGPVRRKQVRWISGGRGYVNVKSERGEESGP
jgi:hypothetical protein